MKKKLMSLVLAMTMILSALPAASANQPSEPHYDDEYQEQAILAYNVLLDYFGRDDTGFPDYPDDFGGAYYNGEHLVVLTTAPLSEKQGFYEDLLAPYSVEIKTCEFSYNELNENGRAVAESLDVPLVQYGVNESNNCFKIVVEGEENLDKLQSRAMPLSTSEIPITFEVGEPAQMTTSVIGGEELLFINTNTGESSSFSAGLCGTWNNTPVLLTCGHSFISLGTDIQYFPVFYGSENVKIGNLETFSCGSNYGVQTTGDWAIIRLDSSVTPTNEIFADFRGNLYKISQKATAVPSGVRLWGSGQHNKSYAGIVNAVDQIVTLKVTNTTYITINGLTTLNFTIGKAQQGDSGGTNYFVSNGENTFYGTLTGGSSTTFYSSPYYWATDFVPKTY